MGSTKEITVTLKVRKFAAPAAALAALALIAFVVFKLLPGKGGPSAPGQPVRTEAAREVPSRQPAGSGAKAAVPEVKPSVTPVAPNAEEKKGREPGALPAAGKVDLKTQGAPAAPAPQDPEAASASLAQARASAARVVALKSGVDEKSLFVRLADGVMSDAQKAFGQKRYVDARGMGVVSEKLFRTCQEKTKDEDRLKAFRKYVEGLRGDIDDLRPKPVGNKVLDAAKEAEKQGKGLQSGKDIENAVRSYVQAAIGYQRTLGFLK